MATFDCTYEQLKGVAADYIQAIDTLSSDELDNGLKCFNLYYLGMQDKHAAERQMAAYLFQYVASQYHKRERCLLVAS